MDLGRPGRRRDAPTPAVPSRDSAQTAHVRPDRREPRSMNVALVRQISAPSSTGTTAAGSSPASVLLEGEYARQTYNDFPTADIRNGGKFRRMMVGGVVPF